MKTQILYILVSSEADVYLEQAYVSAFSARRQNPDARILLLTDRVTADGWLQQNPLSEAFKALFTEIVVADLDPSLPGMQRSRLLKTGMRQFIKGDFLFIDADTVVARSLEDIDEVEANLAAVPDLHSPFISHPHRQPTINMCRKLGYDVSQDRYYYNSGVLLVRDTPENHTFFQCWQQNYLAGWQKGIRPDQPSLAQTAAGTALSCLPDIWNVEVQNGVRYLHDAYIVHYMVTNLTGGQLEKLYLLNDREVMLRMRNAGRITEEIWNVLQDPIHGYAPVTQVFAGEDVHFFRTRRYKWLRKSFQRGKFSFLEWCLKVKDHLLKRV